VYECYLPLRVGEYVVCGLPEEQYLGKLLRGPVYVPEEKVAGRVFRFAGPEDIRRWKQNLEEERRAFKVCKERIEARVLPMKLVDVDVELFRRKIKFYFVADGRIDFRELVRDLAKVFRTRIEMRQIGVRDYAKRLGGVGLCGRSLCCCTFLREFVPITLQSARIQQLSVSPQKISGLCGRLMCCLEYESKFYEEETSKFPSVGSVVDTNKGKGKVISINVFARTIRVQYEDGGEETLSIDALEWKKGWGLSSLLKGG